MLAQLLITLLVLNPFPHQEEKIDGKMLIGKWQIETPPPGVDKQVIEFVKEDKIVFTFESKEGTKKSEGTYKLDGDKLNIKIELNGQKLDWKRKIVKLTAAELVSRDEEMKADRKFKKVK